MLRWPGAAGLAGLGLGRAVGVLSSMRGVVSGFGQVGREGGREGERVVGILRILMRTCFMRDVWYNILTLAKEVVTMIRKKTLADTAKVAVWEMIVSLEDEVCTRCVEYMGSCPCDGDTADVRCYEWGRIDDLEEIGKTIQRLIGHVM